MKTAHPFPLYIKAQTGSSVVIGCSGNTNINGRAGPENDLEAELLHSFRLLSVRERIEVMQAIYAAIDHRKVAEQTPTAPEQSRLARKGFRWTTL